MKIRALLFIYILSVTMFTACKSKKDSSESRSEDTVIAESSSQENKKNPKSLGGADSPPNNPKTLGTDQKDSSTTSLEGSDINKVEAEKIISSYLELKNDLVNSKSEKAGKSAGEIVEVLLLKKDEFSQGISAEAENIMKSMVLEDQRKHFSSLTKLIYTLANEADVDKELYYQYCPMAFNNNGAYWLSSESEIRNPYFGDKMLRCGSTKEIIQ